MIDARSEQELDVLIKRKTGSISNTSTSVVTSLAKVPEDLEVDESSPRNKELAKLNLE